MKMCIRDSGLPVVRAYNAEAYQENKFEIANNELTDTQLYTSRSMAIMMPVITTMMSALSLIIYWICLLYTSIMRMAIRNPLYR